MSPHPTSGSLMSVIGQRLVLSLATACTAVAVSACAAAGGEHACGAQVAAVDAAVPAFSGSLLDGTAVDLDGYGTGIVVFNVWGSWCGPCRSEAAQLKQAAESLDGAGVRFLGVTVRDSRASALAFEEEFAIPYPSVFDETSALAAGLGAASPPATFVAADGRLVAEITGETDAATITCAVEAAGAA